MNNKLPVSYKRIPNHIGIIPDGNRRWALGQGLEKKDGYRHGVEPGLRLTQLLVEAGVKEATFYGFTKDNNKRQPQQREAFTRACIEAVTSLENQDANLLVIGNTKSPAFPRELLPYGNRRVCFGKGVINLNFLVNYDWSWDLKNALTTGTIASACLPRMELIIRWGGRRRLSGFLPVQSVYSDFFILDSFWPDFDDSHFHAAMEWYQGCDVTLGG